MRLRFGKGIRRRAFLHGAASSLPAMMFFSQRSYVMGTLTFMSTLSTILYHARHIVLRLALQTCLSYGSPGQWSLLSARQAYFFFILRRKCKTGDRHEERAHAQRRKKRMPSLRVYRDIAPMSPSSPFSPQTLRGKKRRSRHASPGSRSPVVSSLFFSPGASGTGGMEGTGGRPGKARKRSRSPKKKKSKGRR